MLRDPRADAPRRRHGHGADSRRDGVRPEPGQAVLERLLARARPPRAVEQEHARAGGRRAARWPLQQRGGRQRAAVLAQRHAGRGYQRADGAAVLLLRVQPPDRLAETVGGRGDRPRVPGTGQADPFASKYVCPIFVGRPISGG